MNPLLCTNFLSDDTNLRFIVFVYGSQFLQRGSKFRDDHLLYNIEDVAVFGYYSNQLELDYFEKRLHNKYYLNTRLYNLSNNTAHLRG
jgi:hypothetical protein